MKCCEYRAKPLLEALQPGSPSVSHHQATFSYNAVNVIGKGYLFFDNELDVLLVTHSPDAHLDGLVGKTKWSN